MKNEIEVTDKEKKDLISLAKMTVSILEEEGKIKEFITCTEENRKDLVIKYVGMAVDRFSKFAKEIQNNPAAKEVFCQRVYHLLTA
jgi:hypothetical protein